MSHKPAPGLQVATGVGSGEPTPKRKNRTKVWKDESSPQDEEQNLKGRVTQTDLTGQCWVGEGTEPRCHTWKDALGASLSPGPRVKTSFQSG